MGEWLLDDRGLKRYPHFDAWISTDQAIDLARDPMRVAEHGFFPFILYHQSWTRFAKKGEKGKRKVRPIRYAARADAYIFSRYRHILSELYEAALDDHNLSGSVLAYRRILDEGGGGKCNIHFARDTFEMISEIGDCSVIALDISGFFESLDHSRLKTIWCKLLGKRQLPDDHYQVFKAITKYAVVDKEDLYRRLGHFGAKRKTKSGTPINGYLTPFKEMPTHLCTGKDFRNKVAGGNGQKNLIKKNYKQYGIPQGAPLSDLLANMYLLDFDRIMSDRVHSQGGQYYRYSDDILIIIPGNQSGGLQMMEWVRKLMPCFGRQLVIKEEKSQVFLFRREGNQQIFKHVHGGSGLNGLEYLGFRYDGKNVYLRDSTLSNLNRKIVRAANREANKLARRYPNKDGTQLQAIFDYEHLIKNFGRVENFGEKHEDYRRWTFWTYARRASDVFGTSGRRIIRQLKNHRRNVYAQVDRAITKAVARRDEKYSVP